MKRSVKSLVAFCLSVAIATSLFSQRKTLPKVEILNTGAKTSIRGLSVVNNNIVWVSGSNGIVGKSSNAGKNWKWMVVKGFEKSDFRDIEAFDANTAIIMAIAEPADAPAYILKTADGGDSWKIVYENKTKGMFLDAMEFRDPKNGMVIGDPIDGRFFIAKQLMVVIHGMNCLLKKDLLQIAVKPSLHQAVRIFACCSIDQLL